MNYSNFQKGIILTSLGSLWWGIIGVFYFESISFVGHIEVVIHRCIWTAVALILTSLYLKKQKNFLKILKNKKLLFYLFISGFLIFLNWAVWIYAVATNKIIDASFGYFMMPILSVLFGYVFFKEILNFRKKLSIFLVLISILILFSDLNSIPWVGLSVAISWSTYNLIRKKINVETDIGLLIESLFILPFAIFAFYIIIKNDFNDFSLSNPPLMFYLLLAGPMTVIPLFLYVKGVELCGLGPTGMIFYITPTCQFLLGFFYYNETFEIEKFISFILIWIAIFIYLRELNENN